MIRYSVRYKSAWDLYYQIKLFHPDDRTDLPIAPPDLRQFFRNVEAGTSRLRDLLVHLLIRRTRNHILRFHGYDAETHQKVDPSRFEEYRSGRRGISGQDLLGELQRIFFQYNLRDIVSRVQVAAEEETSRIVCSEALL